MPLWASLVVQMVKNLLAMQETQVWSLGWEVPLERGMATHSSILAWRILWTEEPVRLHLLLLPRVRHNCVTPEVSFSWLLFLSPFIPPFCTLFSLCLSPCDQSQQNSIYSKQSHSHQWNSYKTNMSFMCKYRWLLYSMTSVWQYSVQFSSVAQLCPTLCDPMNRDSIILW